MIHFRLNNCAAAVAATAFLLSAIPALAHEGHEHGKGVAPADASQPVTGQPVPPPLDTAALNVINNRYLRDVKTIFKRACFDCHSEQTRYPSYYIIPGVRQFIDYDIREARKHVDMNADYPFKGHGSPLKDLKAIQKEVEEGDMPPFIYNIAHWKERLTNDEKLIILRWATEGIKLLPAEAEEPSAGK